MNVYRVFFSTDGNRLKKTMLTASSLVEAMATVQNREIENNNTGILRGLNMAEKELAALKKKLAKVGKKDAELREGLKWNIAEYENDIAYDKRRLIDAGAVVITSVELIGELDTVKSVNA